MVSSTNSKDIVANTIAVIDEDKVIDLKELVLSNLAASHNIVGLPVDTLHSLHKLAEAINSDANFFDTIMHAINLRPDLKYDNTLFDSIIRNVLNHDTLDVSAITCLTKSHKVNT